MQPTPAPAFSDAQATWNERFSRDGYVFGTEPNAWLQQNAGLWGRPSRLLCVADGEGRNSVWLAGQGHRVDAFDISEVGVRKAQALAAGKGVQVQYSVAGCEDFDWGENRYDGVAAIFVQFADPALRRQMFARIARCLRPGGVLLLQGYTPRQLELRTGGPGILSHLYTPAQLALELQGLAITRVEEYEAELREGSGHAGLSALLGLTAFKPC